MALGDVDAFHEWLERENPPYKLVRSVEAWLEGLENAPWQAPSEQVMEMTILGQYHPRSHYFGC